MTITTGFLIALAAVFILTRPRNKPGRKRATGRRTTTAYTPSPYRCASIGPGKTACPAIANIGHKRFLSRDAPRLPLPGCSVEKCDCRYVRHEDRRKAEDRRAMFSLRADLYSVSGDADRRMRARGRRETDTDETRGLVDIDYDNIEWTT